MFGIFFFCVFFSEDKAYLLESIFFVVEMLKSVECFIIEVYLMIWPFIMYEYCTAFGGAALIATAFVISLIGKY